jgi:phenylacetate-CoA ligase
MSDEALRLRHVSDALARAPELIERLDWAPGRLSAHRTVMFRDLLRVAAARSPWHRARLAGLELSAIDETALRGLPVMTKDDLMTNFDEIVTDPRLRLDRVEAHLDAVPAQRYLFGRYHAVVSGGSSGRRGVFVYDWDAFALSYLGLMRHEWRAQRAATAAGAAPVAMAVVSAGKPVHASNAIAMAFSHPQLRMHPFPVTQPMDEIVGGLNALAPAVLSGYPSVLHALAHEAGAGRLKISPARVITYAEPLLPETRAALETAWAAPVCNWWCTSEAYGMAVSCGQGPGLHLTEDLSIIEPVDIHGRPVGPGERSAKVYLTNLVNHVQPLIRYEITDEITVLGQRCPCGCAHRLIADVQGRLDDSFHYAGITVHPHVFRSVLGRRRNIIEYQVRQTPRGVAVHAHCAGPVDRAALGAGIAAALAGLGVPRPAVTVTLTDRLQRAGAGKLQRFVPLTRATPDARCGCGAG